MATKVDNVKIRMSAEGAAAVASQLKSVDSQISNMASAVKGLGGLFAAQQIGQFLGSAIKAAAESEIAYKRLELTVNRLGGVYSTVSARVERFASQLQRSSEITDEQAVGAINRLYIGLGDINLSMRAAQVAADLAANGFIEFESAVSLLTRGALGSTEMFRRFGIRIDDAAVKARGFTSLLEQLEAQVGGTAAATTDTLGGAISQLTTQIGELSEALGSKVGVKENIQGLAGGFDLLAQVVAKSDGPVAAIANLVTIIAAGPNSLLLALKKLNAAGGLKEGGPAIFEGMTVTAESLEKRFERLRAEADALSNRSQSIADRIAGIRGVGQRGEKITGGPQFIETPEAVESSQRLIERMYRDSFVRNGSVMRAFFDEYESRARETAQAITSALSPLTDGLVDAFFGATVRIEEIFKQMLATLAKQLLQSVLFRFLVNLLLPGAGTITAPSLLPSGPAGIVPAGAPGLPMSTIININAADATARGQSQMISSVIGTLQTAARNGGVAISSASDWGSGGGYQRSVIMNLSVARG